MRFFSGSPGHGAVETDVGITASIGWTAQNTEEAISPDELIKRADDAMYDAKSAGRRCSRGRR